MSDGVRFEASLERSRQRVAERDATLVAAGAHQEKTAGRRAGSMVLACWRRSGSL